MIDGSIKWTKNTLAWRNAVLAIDIFHKIASVVVEIEGKLYSIPLTALPSGRSDIYPAVVELIA